MKLILALCLGAALVLGGAYTAYWYYVAGRLQAGIDDWAQQQRALGHEVAFQDGAIGGFPFAFRRDFGASRLAFRQGATALMVSAQAATAELRPWNLNHVVFAARELSASAAQGNFEAAEASGSIDIPRQAPADYHQPFLGFDVTLLTLQLPDGRRAVTAAPIERVAALGAIMGPIPPAASLQEAIAGWAEAGGVLELKHFGVVQAPLDLTGEGTLALDEMLQPLGALTIRAHGLPETIALLEEDGMIDARSAKTAKLMAEGLAKRDDAGKETVTVSLSLQQGYLWLGPVKLAALPALIW